MEQLLERVNKLPIAAKAGAIVAILIALTAGTYFLFITDTESQIESLTSEKDSLTKRFAEKKEIADNLIERRRDLDQLEQKLQEALTFLPNNKNIDELLATLNDLGRKSGLEITRVTPGVETPKSFYAEIPIAMSVKGNYHEIAVFLHEVSKMPRIVNVNNLRLTSPALRNDKVILNSEFLATTFRFVSKPAAKAPGSPAGGGQ